jgi:osmoprotectant transport system ATP-binding protein
VARALAADPDILLMDEPFSALDPITREELQGEFTRLQRRLHKTVVLVTHDLLEGLRLGDRMVVMRQGRVERTGTPREILDDPGSDFLERFLGRHRALLRAQLDDGQRGA